jgi:phage/plasmid-associated DNA primase
MSMKTKSRGFRRKASPLQLGDASGALTSRMILLVTTKSFYGMEDVSLESKLLAELPGIFNWCLTGRARLYQRGYFVEPKASKHMKIEIDGLNSPINLFLDETTVPATELIRIVQAGSLEPKVQASILNELLQYTQPKLKSIEVKGKFELTEEQIDHRIKSLMQSMD